ncbi:unnamed protein product [Effrenium voratum]|uniref:Uncharacterized protein n=1 Tax=Effrenium voratum TaxID=2562239 RepID=A0AA36HWN3_9DINO|nr:unnamed protein product [Effrenium voratum]CAJ1375997.1 unnamed protein product [Effrenium voratum]CAJ1428194.1 unnamed protein product [Effrenium voratum]
MLRLLLLAPFGARGMECSSILDGTSCGINGRCGTDPSTRESKCLLEDVIACEGKAKGDTCTLSVGKSSHTYICTEDGSGLRCSEDCGPRPDGVDCEQFMWQLSSTDLYMSDSKCGTSAVSADRKCLPRQEVACEGLSAGAVCSFFKDSEDVSVCQSSGGGLECLPANAAPAGAQEGDSCTKYVKKSNRCSSYDLSYRSKYGRESASEPLVCLEGDKAACYGKPRDAPCDGYEDAGFESKPGGGCLPGPFLFKYTGGYCDDRETCDGATKGEQSALIASARGLSLGFGFSLAMLAL